MTKIVERLNSLEERLKVIEHELGIIRDVSDEVSEKKKESPPEKKIKGFSKEELRVMFSWAQNIKLIELSKGDFEELKKWQMLKEFYPDSPMDYDEIKR